jgi:hypothetical protein
VFALIVNIQQHPHDLETSAKQEPYVRGLYDCLVQRCRKGCIIRLQRHLHELMLDQLPVLRQLARVLDEMSLGVDNAAAAAAAGSNSNASRLILEQVGGRS